MAIGHGGQVLCSAATAEIVGDSAVLVDLGEHRLRDLDRPMHVFQIGAGTFAPLRSLDSFLGNLPLQVSSFIGREQELVRGVEAVRSSRTVTLTGVGGVGKTRLALQLAAEVLPTFRDGAWLVELAAVRDPERVADTVAAVFGLVGRGAGSVSDTVVEFLSTKQMLLVLDNCEHLLDAVADLVGRVGRSCGGVVVLATSREGLAVEGEQILAVPSLSLPHRDTDLAQIGRCDAVALFVERARRVEADFSLSADNAAVVGQVCRRLDGMPLAIELAAARVNAMTMPELARGLDHRFETLAGGRRGEVPRHQTLRAVIDWSYDLLNEAERRLLIRLSVFSGGCTRESAVMVCGVEPVDSSRVFALLSGLVVRSLVVADREGLDTRYRLLETIREYGEERLAEQGETEIVRARHGDHYLHLACRLSEEIDGPDQAAAERRLLAEQDNRLAASANAVDSGDLDVALGLWTSHWGQVQSFITLPPLLVEPFEMSGADEHRLYPAALASSAKLAAASGDLQTARNRCAAATQAALRLDIRDPYLDHEVQTSLAGALSTSGFLTAAAVQYERSAEVARSAGMSTALASSLVLAAQQYVLLDDRARALPLAAEALPLARRLGRPGLLASNLNVLAAAIFDEVPEQARTFCKKANRSPPTSGKLDRKVLPPLSPRRACGTGSASSTWPAR
jgi:predicted ATPase